MTAAPAIKASDPTTHHCPRCGAPNARLYLIGGKQIDYLCAGCAGPQP